MIIIPIILSVLLFVIIKCYFMKTEDTKTTKDIIIDSSFKLFLEKSYEQVTVKDIEKATGLTRGSIFYHVMNKEDLFLKVIDKYIIDTQRIKKKMRINKETTLEGFIQKYFKGVQKTMDYMYSSNIYKSYFFLIMQATIHYPHFDEKATELIDTENKAWEKIIKQAIQSGEIHEDTDVKEAIIRFRCGFLGLAFMRSLTEGMHINELIEYYTATYNSLKKKA